MQKHVENEKRKKAQAKQKEPAQDTGDQKQGPSEPVRPEQYHELDGTPWAKEREQIDKLIVSLVDRFGDKGVKAIEEAVEKINNFDEQMHGAVDLLMDINQNLEKLDIRGKLLSSQLMVITESFAQVVKIINTPGEDEDQESEAKKNGQGD